MSPKLSNDVLIKTLDAGAKLRKCQEKFCAVQLEAANKNAESFRAAINQLYLDLRDKNINISTFVEKLKEEQNKLMFAPTSVELTQCTFNNNKCAMHAKEILSQLLLNLKQIPKATLKQGKQLLQQDNIDAVEYLKLVDELRKLPQK